MNKVLKLTLLMLKNGINLQGKKSKNGKKAKSRLWIYIIIGTAFLPTFAILCMLAAELYKAFDTVGQSGLIVGLALSASALVTFMFGIIYTMSVFYFSSDIERILALPLKPWQMVTSKFVVVLVYEYLTQFVVMGPFLGMYAYMSGAGFADVLMYIFIFLLFPIFPIVMASVLVMIIMQFGKLFKNKDMFRMVSGIIALLFGFSFSFSVNRLAGTAFSADRIMELMQQGGNSLISMVSGIFPTSRFAAKAIILGGVDAILNLLIFIVVTIAAYIIFTFLSEIMYFKGLYGISESSAKRKVLSQSDISKYTTSNTTFYAVFMKEIKILFRTPIYFLNCILMNFIWPFTLGIVYFAQPELANTINQFAGTISNPANFGIVYAIGSAVLLFVASTNTVCSTAISREGKNLYITKYIPVSIKTQISAKLWSGIIIALIGFVVFTVFIVLVMPLPFMVLFAILLTGISGLSFMSAFGLIIDISRPKLEWDNEQMAVKQNVNPLFSIMAGWGIMAIPLLMIFVGKFDWLLAVLLINLLLIVINIITYKYLFSKSIDVYNEINA